MNLTPTVCLVIALLPGVVVRSTASARDSTPVRNQGDEAGPYVIETLDKDRVKKTGEIRSYIWGHWSDRQRGRLVARWFSKEGVASDVIYILDPDERGVCSLKVSIERPTLKGTNAAHSEYKAYSIERIELRREGQSESVKIPEQETRSGETFQLVFYDENGKKISGV
jgi:hypothetical protein